MDHWLRWKIETAKNIPFCQKVFIMWQKLNIFRQLLKVSSVLISEVAMDRILASHPAAPDSILGVPKNVSLDAADIY